MNLAKIKRKKIPVQAGRSNALPPLDAIAEREKSAPVQGTEGYATLQEKVKDVVSSQDSGSVTAKTMLANKQAANPTKQPTLKAEDQKTQAKADTQPEVKVKEDAKTVESTSQ